MEAYHCKTRTFVAWLSSTTFVCQMPKLGRFRTLYTEGIRSLHERRRLHRLRLEMDHRQHVERAKWLNGERALIGSSSRRVPAISLTSEPGILEISVSMSRTSLLFRDKGFVLVNQRTFPVTSVIPSSRFSICLHLTKHPR